MDLSRKKFAILTLLLISVYSIESAQISNSSETLKQTNGKLKTELISNFLTIQANLIKYLFLLIKDASLKLEIAQLSTTKSITTTSVIKEEAIIDNTYRVNENDNVDLKCPIEITKQPDNTNDSNEDNDESVNGNENEDNLDDAEYYTSDTDSTQGKVSKRDDEIFAKKKSKSFYVVNWYKDSAKINKISNSNNEARVKQNGIYLIIKNVSPSDSGKYKCKLINGFGSVSTTLNLIVIPQLVNTTTTGATKRVVDITKKENEFRPPVFTSPERMKQSFFKKPKGSMVRFKCRAVGIPKPDILWFKNGEIMSEEDYGITR
jgi:hypothetical protein